MYDIVCCLSNYLCTGFAYPCIELIQALRCDGHRPQFANGQQLAYCDLHTVCSLVSMNKMLQRMAANASHQQTIQGFDKTGCFGGTRLAHI